jgi:hypothetical protein
MEYVRIGNVLDTERQGSIYMTADEDNAPYINIIGGVANITDWNTPGVLKTRIGNMKGSYGCNADEYGIGIGDFDAGNYLSYNAEAADGFVLKAGGGNIAIDSNGISLINGLTTSSSIRWLTTGGDGISSISSYLNPVSGSSDLSLVSGSSADPPGKVEIKVWYSPLPTALSISLTVDSSGIKMFGTVGESTTLDVDGTGLFHSLHVGGSVASGDDSLIVDGTATIARTVYIGDTENADCTLGLTINQGANYDHAISVKSSKVNHGMTSISEADTYFVVSRMSDDYGAAYLAGMANSAYKRGIQLTGISGADTTKSTSGEAPVVFSGRKVAGTTQEVLAATENVVVMRNLTTTEWILGGNGNTWQNGGITALGGANIDSNTLVVDATNNRVGIGTASPSVDLHILNDGSPVPTIRLENSAFSGILKWTDLYHSSGGDFTIVNNRTNSSTGGILFCTGGSTTAKVSIPYAGGVTIATGVLKVGTLQVVGARVVDARADDTVNTSTWDSTTAGVLDALRDAMVSHGLIAAA